MSDRKINKLTKGIYHFPGVDYYRLDRLDNYFPDDPNTIGVEIHPDGWGQVETQKGVYDWKVFDVIADRFYEKGKDVAVRIQCASFQSDDTPRWLYNDFGVRKIPLEAAFTDFSNLKGFMLGETAKVENGESFRPFEHNKQYLKGNGRLVSTGLRAFSNDYGQTIGFDFLAVTDGIFKVLTEKSGVETAAFEIALTKGDRGGKNIDISPELIGGACNLTLYYEGEISLGNLCVSEDRPGLYSFGNTCFPNYFDPIFKKHYADFVKAFADRYKNDPRVKAVCVGGFGYWDEVSLPAADGQWIVYGYTAERYLEHMRWCGDLFNECFKDSDKQIFMHGYTEWTPGEKGEAEYVSRRIMNYIADNGFGLKTNSLQAKLTEWESLGGTGWSYMVNRLKRRGVDIFHEQAAQCSNPEKIFNNMGHPLSMLNRAIIDEVDYYWIYAKDLYTPSFSKYLPYANEAAGAGLFTTLYIIFGRYPFYQSNGEITHHHDNILCGLWLRENEWNSFVNIGGKPALALKSADAPAEISIDDRQKYDGFYNAVLSVEYLANGEGTLEFYVRSESEQDLKLVGTIETGATDGWAGKGFALPTEWGHTHRNHGCDMSHEIVIVHKCGAPIYLSFLEVSGVPALKWAEEDSVTPLKITGEMDADNAEFEIPITPFSYASTAVIPVRTVNFEGESNLVAEVYAKSQSGEIALVSKRKLYMSSNVRDDLIVPLAQSDYDVVSYIIKLKTLLGKMAVLTGEDNLPAVSIKKYQSYEGNYLFDGRDILCEQPFVSISVGDESDDKEFILFKEVYGEYYPVKNGVIAGGIAYTTPMTAGRYRIEVAGIVTKGAPRYLKRKTSANKPLNGPLCGKACEISWSMSSGFYDVDFDNGFFAAINKREPYFESNAINIATSKSHSIYFSFKNESSSNFVKLEFEKCDKTSGYILIPVLANDREYRDYDFPIGNEVSYTGELSKIKFYPITGECAAGRISIKALEIKDSTLSSESISKIKILVKGHAEK